MVDRQPLVSGSRLSRVFKDGAQRVFALQDVSVDLYPGEIVLTLGLSGSGKTTLLNLLGCMDQPTTGRITVSSRDASIAGLTLRRDVIGFVFQEANLIPWLTAYENVELGLLLCHRKPEKPLVLDALERVGATRIADASPRDLSGGETQRVAMARAIVKRPRVLLADEPTAHLDPSAAQDVFELLRSFANDDGLTVLVTTHDQRLGRFADRIIQLRHGCLIN